MTVIDEASAFCMVYIRANMIMCWFWSIFFDKDKMLWWHTDIAFGNQKRHCCQCVNDKLTGIAKTLCFHLRTDVSTRKFQKKFWNGPDIVAREIIPANKESDEWIWMNTWIVMSFVEKLRRFGRCLSSLFWSTDCEKITFCTVSAFS